ncbi:MAG: hypothetical protein GY938_08805 [Ketobacter sp.]|nr:hypothetical protein [Ketobacter sp.]
MEITHLVQLPLEAADGLLETGNLNGEIALSVLGGLQTLLARVEVGFKLTSEVFDVVEFLLDQFELLLQLLVSGVGLLKSGDLDGQVGDLRLELKGQLLDLGVEVAHFAVKSLDLAGHGVFLFLAQIEVDFDLGEAGELLIASIELVRYVCHLRLKAVVRLGQACNLDVEGVDIRLHAADFSLEGLVLSLALSELHINLIELRFELDQLFHLCLEVLVLGRHLVDLSLQLAVGIGEIGDFYGENVHFFLDLGELLAYVFQLSCALR